MFWETLFVIRTNANSGTDASSRFRDGATLKGTRRFASVPTGVGLSAQIPALDSKGES
jgi:hypothetical protein